jgi:hypothetical protein
MSTFNLRQEVKISNGKSTCYVDLVTAVRIILAQENSIPLPIEGHTRHILEFNARMSDEAERILLQIPEENCWIRHFAVRRNMSNVGPDKYVTNWQVDLPGFKFEDLYKVLEQWEYERKI